MEVNVHSHTERKKLTHYLWFDKQETINIVAFYGRAGLSSIRRTYFQRYVDLSAALLDVLRKEYHLN